LPDDDSEKFKIKEDLSGSQNLTTIILQNESMHDDSPSLQSSTNPPLTPLTPPTPPSPPSTLPKSTPLTPPKTPNPSNPCNPPKDPLTNPNSNSKNFQLPPSTIILELDDSDSDSCQWKETIVKREIRENPSYLTYEYDENKILEETMFIKRRPISSCLIWDPACMTEEIVGKLEGVMGFVRGKWWKGFGIEDFRDFMIECMCDGEECLEEIYGEGDLFRIFIGERKKMK
jgi:hypothetical protein